MSMREEPVMIAELSAVATYDSKGGVAEIVIDSPPVNALSHAVRLGLVKGIERSAADTDVKAVVIRCAGRTFFAGADISEFDSGIREPDLLAVLRAIEDSPKPVIAALHGTALGGGLELALACHYRIAAPSAKLGLPEVSLGLLPGAGGTQRLPRVIGAPAALDMMVFGKPIGADKALALGLVDRLADSDTMLAAAARDFARTLIDRAQPLRKVSAREDELLAARADPGLFVAFRQKNARALRGFKAPENIIQAVEAAVTLPFDQGMTREGELFLELFQGTQSAALRHLFFAQRAAAKVPGLAPDAVALPVANVGVIGAGTMGGGIAMNFLNAGLPVTIVEQSQEALDRGVATIRRNYEATAKKGRLTAEQVEQRLGLLTPSIDFGALAAADLVIEAVFEKIDLKKEIFARLDQVAKPGAILASNTSFLDLDAIAAATSRPDSVIGLHFFSPANVMPLLEVVRGARTSDALIATAMQLARRIGKTAVLSRACHGFIANRAMAVRSEQANRLILEGPMPWDVDRAIADFGFPMGPFAMSDLVGLDVIGWDPSTSAGRSVLEVLCEMDRWGQKKNGGYYDYDAARRPVPSVIAEKVIRDFAAAQDKSARTLSDEEIVERLLYPVINECARILDEGVAVRASDIDVALTTGYGWPSYTGGPMFWADTVGVDRIVERLDQLALETGDIDTFTPSPLLRRVAQEKSKLAAL
jgi:3-hydroxyacyl-CoA dehydrogenase